MNNKQLLLLLLLLPTASSAQSYFDFSFSLNFDGSSVKFDCELVPNKSCCSSEAEKRLLFLLTGLANGTAKGIVQTSMQEYIARSSFTPEKQKIIIDKITKQIAHNNVIGKTCLEQSVAYDQLINNP